MFKPLLRVIPSLSGNVKIACKVTNIFNEDENANTQTKIYKAYVRDGNLLPISEGTHQNRIIKTHFLNNAYGYDLKNFYKYYNKNFYKSSYIFNENIEVLDKTIENKQRDTDFEFGAKRISYQLNKYNFEFFAPIYIEGKEDIPEEFVLILKHKEKTKEIHIKLNEVDENGKYNKNNYLGVYLKNTAEKIDNKVIFTTNDKTIYYGTSLKTGTNLSLNDTLYNSFSNQMTINNMDNLINKGFERHGIVMSQIIPLSFFINLEDLDIPIFAKINISGYYIKNKKRVNLYDFSINYKEFYPLYYKFNEITKELDLTKSTVNIMDMSTSGSLKEKTYYKYKYSNKILPNYNRWKIQCSEDDDPYIFNTNISYSKINKTNCNYGQYPIKQFSILPGIGDKFEYIKEEYRNYLTSKDVKDDFFECKYYFKNNLVLPPYDVLNQYYTNSDKKKYNDYMNYYNTFWYDVVNENFVSDLNTFINQDWADVKNGFCMYKGVLYDLNGLKDKINRDIQVDKFGIFVLPKISIESFKNYTYENAAYYIILNENKDNVSLNIKSIDITSNCIFENNNKSILISKSKVGNNDYFDYGKDFYVKNTLQTINSLKYIGEYDENGENENVDDFDFSSLKGTYLDDHGFYYRYNLDTSLLQVLYRDEDRLDQTMNLGDHTYNYEPGFFNKNVWFKKNDLMKLLTFFMSDDRFRKNYQKLFKRKNIDIQEYNIFNIENYVFSDTINGYVELFKVKYKNIRPLLNYIRGLKDSNNAYSGDLKKYLYLCSKTFGFERLSSIRTSFFKEENKQLNDEIVTLYYKDSTQFCTNMFSFGDNNEKYYSLTEIFDALYKDNNSFYDIFRNDLNIIEYFYFPVDQNDIDNVFKCPIYYESELITDNEEYHIKANYRYNDDTPYYKYTNFRGLKTGKYIDELNQIYKENELNRVNVNNHILKYIYNDVLLVDPYNFENIYKRLYPKSNWITFKNKLNIYKDKYFQFLNKTHIDKYINIINPNPSNEYQIYLRKRVITKNLFNLEYRDVYTNLDEILENQDLSFDYNKIFKYIKEIDELKFAFTEEIYFLKERDLTIFNNLLYYFNINESQILDISFEILFKKDMFVLDELIFNNIILNSVGLNDPIDINKNYKDLFIYRLQQPEEYDYNFNFRYDTQSGFNQFLLDYHKTYKSGDLVYTPFFDSVYLQGREHSKYYITYLEGNIYPLLTYNIESNIEDKIFGYNIKRDDINFIYEINPEEIPLMSEISRERRYIYELPKCQYKFDNDLFLIPYNDKLYNNNNNDNLVVRQVLNNELKSIKYGFYLIRADLDNSKRTFNVYYKNGCRINFLDRIQNLELDNTNIFKYFKLLTPFINSIPDLNNLFSTLHYKNSPYQITQKIKFLSKNISNDYLDDSSELITGENIRDNNTYSDIITYNSLNKNISLYRYLTYINPYFEKVKENIFLYNQNFKEDNNNDYSLVHKLSYDYTSINQYTGISLFYYISYFNSKDLKELKYIPFEYKYFNDSCIFNLPNEIILENNNEKYEEINHEFAYEEDEENNTEIVDLLKKKYSFFKNLNDEEILFLINKYNIKSNRSYLRYIPDLNQNVYTIKYNLTLK